MLKSKINSQSEKRLTSAMRTIAICCGWRKHRSPKHMSASTLFKLKSDVTYRTTNQTRASTAAVASLLQVSLHYTNQNRDQQRNSEPGLQDKMSFLL